MNPQIEINGNKKKTEVKKIWKNEIMYTKK